jgi:hypothetical protein
MPAQRRAYGLYGRPVLGSEPRNSLKMFRISSDERFSFFQGCSGYENISIGQ